MTYTVKEIFYSLQGEGAQVGRPTVFVRFAGCNLWTGRESDRATATCGFCDTDFVGVGPDGGKFESADALADAVADRWPTMVAWAPNRPSPAPSPTHPAEARSLRPYVVCTGGEPLLQLDAPAIHALHARGFEVGVETNGTIAPPPDLDWMCVSPKADAPLAVTRGNELKLVYPQENAPPERFAALAFDVFSLQPMDGPDRETNTQRAVAYVLAHPQWRLSLQTHKLLGLR